MDNSSLLSAVSTAVISYDDLLSMINWSALRIS